MKISRFMTWLLALLLGGSVFSGCNKVDSFGSELVEDDLLDAKSMVYKNFSFETVHVDDLLMYIRDTLTGWDRVPTGDLFMLGDMNDPVFGNTKASLFAQFVNFGSVDFDPDVDYVIDSVIMSLAFDSAFGVYGDENSSYHLKVHEIIEPMDADRYYSSSSLTVDPMPLGQLLNYRPNPKMGDSITSGSQTIEEFPQIKLRLNNSLGKRMVSLDSVAQDSAEYFVNNVLQGFHVAMERTSGDGGLTRLRVNDGNTRISIYYRHPDSTSNLRYLLTPYRQSLVSNNSSIFGMRFALFNAITNDNIVPNESAEHPYYYLQSGGGQFGKITIDPDDPIFDTINLLDAYIEIPVGGDDIPNYDSTLHSSIGTLFPSIESNDPEILVSTSDFTAAGVNSGVLVQTIENDDGSTRQAFRIKLTRHLNDLLAGKTDKNEVYFVDPLTRISPYRLIIHSENASTYPMHMRLIYSNQN